MLAACSRRWQSRKEVYLSHDGLMVMAKPPKKPKDEDIEVAPDAWERFERAVDSITKTPPKSDGSGALRDGDYFLVVDDRLRIAHPIRMAESGSITADLYRNLDDYRHGRVLERAFVYRR